MVPRPLDEKHVTIEEVNRLLSYDPETGVFIWKIKVGRKIRIGDIAGWIDNNGYRLIRINKLAYRANRLAIVIMESKWPEILVDHKNGVKHDDRYENLRCVSYSGNAQNMRRVLRNSKSQVMGVRQVGNRWKAHITIAGVYKHIGSYTTSEEAHQAYLAVKRSIHECCTL